MANTSKKYKNSGSDGEKGAQELLISWGKNKGKDHRPYS